MAEKAMKFKNFGELLLYVKDNNSDDFLHYRSNDSWKNITPQEFYDTVKYLSLGLKTIMSKQNESIGLIASPSPFWVIVDLAIIIAGGITVPIFTRISPESIQFETEDSNMETIFVDLEKYQFVVKHAKKIKNIVPLNTELIGEKITSFDSLISEGKKIDKSEPDLFKKRIADLNETSLASIIYTSGSSGVPKGVELTHANIMSQVITTHKVLPLKFGDKALTSLPLAHIFERMVIYYYISTGVPIYFVDDINNIGNIIRDVKPTVMTVVPRLLERVYERMKDGAAQNHGIRKVLAMGAINRAEAKSENDKKGLQDIIFSKLVYKKLNDALGGNLRMVISGAAALPKYIGRFFANIGIPIYEGYGMTEASPVIAANKPEANKLGSVGRPYPDVHVKISQEGEILVQGPNVMQGYHNNTSESAKTLEGGWLHTGDLGTLDDEGFLTITGRKKELFKTSTGEYVAPVPIEQALNQSKLIDNSVVIANNRKFVSALIAPNLEEVKNLQADNNFDNLEMDDFLDRDFFLRKVKAHINTVNLHLQHTEKIVKFKIIKKPFTVEDQELTPTLKIRRNFVEDKYATLIEEMYSS